MKMKTKEGKSFYNKHMRIIETSGVILYGDNDAELRVFQIHHGLHSGDLLTHSLRYGDLLTVINQEPKDHRDIFIIINNRENKEKKGRERIFIYDEKRSFGVSLAWMKGKSAMQALEQVVKVEQSNGTPPPNWLTFLMACAAKAYHSERVSEHSATFLIQMALFSYLNRTIKTLDPNADDVDDELARVRASNILDASIAFLKNPLKIEDAISILDPFTPKSPIGLAKLQFALSHMLWHAEKAREISLAIDKHYEYEYDNDLSYNALGLLFGFLEFGGSLLFYPLIFYPIIGRPRIGGARIGTSSSVLNRTWGIYLDLLDANEGEARALLTPWALDAETSAVRLDLSSNESLDPPPTPNRDLAMSMAQDMLKEAESNPAYAPQGVWEAVLPPNLPLRDWGVARIRVVSLVPSRNWAALVDDQGVTISAFRWLPKRWADELPKAAPKSIPMWAWPTIYLAVSALWRDLRIQGESAVPKRGSNQQRGQSPAMPLSVTPSAQKGGASSPLRLPRPVQTVVSKAKEVREWGNADDRDAIHRRVMAMCAVRGHYRKHEYVGDRSDDPRLRAEAEMRRREAVERAARYGLPQPPAGYTFVAPYTRGGHRPSSSDEELKMPPKPVQSKGLMTLTAVMNMKPIEEKQKKVANDHKLMELKKYSLQR